MTSDLAPLTALITEARDLVRELRAVIEAARAGSPRPAGIDGRVFLGLDEAWPNRPIASGFGPMVTDEPLFSADNRSPNFPEPKL